MSKGITVIPLDATLPRSLESTQ